MGHFEGMSLMPHSDLPTTSNPPSWIPLRSYPKHFGWVQKLQILGVLSQIAKNLVVRILNHFAIRSKNVGRTNWQFGSKDIPLKVCEIWGWKCKKPLRLSVALKLDFWPSSRWNVRGTKVHSQLLGDISLGAPPLNSEHGKCPTAEKIKWAKCPLSRPK